MTARMTAPMRRGACPSLVAPMVSGDGLLARLAPPDGLSPAQLAGLARAAGRFGNGLIEVTARGSLQVRGLRPETAPLLAAEVQALGIVLPGGPPVLTGPLAGLDPCEIADPRPLAAALRGFDRPLLPKVSVVVDGGGALHLDAAAADLRLRATPEGWVVAVGGTAATAREVGRFGAEAAVGEGFAILARLSARRMRGRELEVASEVSGGSSQEAVAAVGRFALREGCARGVALPLGQTESGALVALAEAVDASVAVRPAPGRAIVFVGLGEAGDRRLVAAARRLGFVTEPDDPRLLVVACAGAPGCGSGLLETRRIGARLAGEGLLPEGVRLHVSGCPKRCAQPEGPAVTLEGRVDGAVVTGEGTNVPEALQARLIAEAGR
jgi:precorrin-3B synthase